MSNEFFITVTVTKGDKSAHAISMVDESAWDSKELRALYAEQALKAAIKKWKELYDV